jgi:hypothetical protein
MLLVVIITPSLSAAELSLTREGNYLIIRGDSLPTGDIRINYIESYCRAQSTEADWVAHTKIPHTSVLLTAADDKQKLVLRDTLSDGVIVDHTITCHNESVSFAVVAHNPTSSASTVHWAQPCIRLGAFTGYNNDYTIGDPDDYLSKCFIFLNHKLTRLPTVPWSKTARYTPGQVWCPLAVPRSDVNPRPLSTLIPSNGLIGCFSADETMIVATAWEPYQELYQGVARCLHADFRIAGLAPGETKTARGKLYLMPNNIAHLLAQYKTDFPEHHPE